MGQTFERRPFRSWNGHVFSKSEGLGAGLQVACPLCVCQLHWPHFDRLICPTPANGLRLRTHDPESPPSDTARSWGGGVVASRSDLLSSIDRLNRTTGTAPGCRNSETDLARLGPHSLLQFLAVTRNSNCFNSAAMAARRGRVRKVADCRRVSATRASATLPVARVPSRLTELVDFAPSVGHRGPHVADSLIRLSLRSEQVEAKGLGLFPTFGLGRLSRTSCPYLDRNSIPRPPAETAAL